MYVRPVIGCCAALAAILGAGCLRSAEPPEPTPFVFGADGSDAVVDVTVGMEPDEGVAVLTARLANARVTTSEQSMTFFTFTTRTEFCGDGRFNETTDFTSSFGGLSQTTTELRSGTWRVAASAGAFVLEKLVTGSSDGGAPFNEQVPLGLTSDGQLIVGIFVVTPEAASGACR